MTSPRWGLQQQSLGAQRDVIRLALPAPAGLSPGLGGLGVPFSRRTRLPLARAAPADGKPQLRALGDSGRRPPGLQVRGRDGRDARACQPVFPLPWATRARARPPRAIKHAPRRRCHRAPVQSGRSLHLAPRPAPRAQRLTLGAGGGEDQRAAAAKAAATAAAGRAPVWSTVEGSAAEPRGAAPTMAELRSRAPRPPRPSGSG